jgi:hypothetical protein
MRNERFGCREEELGMRKFTVSWIDEFVSGIKNPRRRAAGY